MRAFVALDLDAATLDRACAMADALRATRGVPSAARWVVRHELHITLRFLGEVGEELVPELSNLTRSLAAGAAPRFNAAFTGFPRAERARVAVLELEGATRVVDLCNAAEQRVTQLGVPPESRAPRPHMTLARLPYPLDVRPWLAPEHARIAGAATAVTLYESVARPSGHVYEAIVRTPFGS